MVIHRRAAAAGFAGGLIAFAMVLMLRPIVTHEQAQIARPPAGVSAQQVSALEPDASQDTAYTVSTRERAAAIARAQIWRTPATSIARAHLGADSRTPSLIECRFHFADLGGTTPKFDCLLPSGKELRIKYGHGAEVPAEAAATRLLATLGFGADMVTPLERLRCFGCPNEPFLTSKIAEVTGTQPIVERAADENDDVEFEWVGVEQKFAARPIESESQKGWAFFELDSVDPSKGGAPRAHVDALRLLAVFLAHWDNKGENQRLVCLSDAWRKGTPCPEPFLLVQDLGSTFGPNRVDLDEWEQAEIWEDRAACKLSMEKLPYGGGTFGPTRVSERGRRFFAKLVGELSDAQLTDLFTWARFDKSRSLWKETSPVSEWVRVFKKRARVISEGPQCPDV
jgi:hypothetical protein